MTDEELRDALLGLYAFDSGATVSGIKDESLRRRVIGELAKDLTDSELFSARLSRLAREMFLSEEVIEQGFGLEDIRRFANWYDEHMR